MSVIVEVEGRPVPQGSMTASYNRQTRTAHVHHVQGAALAQWRASIRQAAREAGATPTLTPVRVTIVFGMPRPKSHLAIRRGVYVVRPEFWSAVPAVAPDLDKLVRAVLDALTGVAYDDDKQVVRLYAEKQYGTMTRIVIEDVSDLHTQTTTRLA